MGIPTAVTQPTLRITARVLPGKKIQIQLPPNSVVGEEVDVFVVLSSPPQVEQPNILEFIETARKRYAKRPAEDIEEQIRAERDTWDN
ncbi:MAG: hypothetical protein GDA44_10875 [Prochloron sp. SP5CPC1]|nr:hypothetical protein [Candidatus Paraprochloron terpiosi SP5CPC1]